MITASSDVRSWSIDGNGVAPLLAGTPLAPFAGAVIQFANQYGVDPNFFLAYVRAENNFGLANSFSAVYNDWIDELCLSGGNAFASGCGSPGNGYSYAVYPDGATGVQAAFWQFAAWLPQVGATWGALLNIASGNSPTFLANALSFANANAASYPPHSGGPLICTRDSDCGAGYVCQNGSCVAAGGSGGDGTTLLLLLLVAFLVVDGDI